MPSLEFEHFLGLNPLASPGASFLTCGNGQQYYWCSGGNVVIGDLLDATKQEWNRRGHHGELTTAILSHDRRMMASGESGSSADVIVSDAQTGALIHRFEEHDGTILSVAFSTDDRILATIGALISGSGGDGRSHTGNSTGGGASRFGIGHHDNSAEAIALSGGSTPQSIPGQHPDAAGVRESQLMLWDLSNGCIVCSTTRLPAFTANALFIGFVRDIKRRPTQFYQLATAAQEGVTLWSVDPYAGEMLPTKVIAEGRTNIVRHITTFASSADEEYLYAGSTSGDFLTISLKTQRIVNLVTATKMAICSVIAVGDRVLLGCGDKTIKIYVAATGEFVGQIALDGAVVGLSLSQDHLEVLATTTFGSVQRINLQTMQAIVLSEAHTGGVTSIAFDSGSLERFATASVDGLLKVWDLQEYSVIATAYPRREQGRSVQPQCIAFCNLLFSGWSDGRILAHSAETGENLWMLENAHADGVTAMALSHNRKFLVSAGPGGEVRLWELRTRELISHLKEHKQRVTSVRLFSDDTVALSASRDRCILRWDLRQEKRTHCHMSRMGGINDFVITKDDRFVVSLGQDRRITLWPIHLPNPCFETYLNGEDGEEGFCIAITAEGRHVVTGGSSGILRLWELNLPHGLTQVAEAHGHSCAVRNIAIGLGDKLAVSAGDDGAIFVWWLFTA